jgi:hypothetical protein
VPHTLYVIHGSHPCAAVERAFALKGIPYQRVEAAEAWGDETYQPIARRVLWPRPTCRSPRRAG